MQYLRRVSPDLVCWNEVRGRTVKGAGTGMGIGGLYEGFLQEEIDTWS